MARGIIGTLQLAVAVAFAAPVALLGLEFLRSGDVLLGGGFLAFAALMILIEEYLTTPQDVPAKVAERAVGTALPDDED
ncbi:hypothetical protein ACFQPA_09530 [Halomarina halobia]|uniref:Uncharacterized protein n=1 Tax=Halomarina halobia TaxID=3033386 RepID=A0ABD6ABJ8_9EURY|nr:hypothetical protein [Halomarina sp. PSR21]